MPATMLAVALVIVSAASASAATTAGPTARSTWTATTPTPPLLLSHNLVSHSEKNCDTNQRIGAHHRSRNEPPRSATVALKPGGNHGNRRPPGTHGAVGRQDYCFASPGDGEAPFKG